MAESKPVLKTSDSSSYKSSSTKLGRISDEKGKNKTSIYCQRCPSLVLSPHQAILVRKEFFLPHMYQKCEHTPVEGVTLVDYWHVSDMMTFDNVGFSKTVDSIKYLICADCEEDFITVYGLCSFDPEHSETMKRRKSRHQRDLELNNRRSGRSC